MDRSVYNLKVNLLWYLTVEGIHKALCMHLLYLFLFIILTASGELTDGPNVCKESVSVRLSRSIPETYIEHVNCPGQQLPCVLTRYKTEYYMGEKNVRYCCPGWSRSGNNCSQPCLANTYGRGCNQTCSCTNANTFCNPALGCLCNPGYKTPNCTAHCDEGSFGSSCTQECTCLNGATCDPVNGSCSCTPGWAGVNCNTTCPAGRFGADCVGNCSCGTGSTCDHVTGSCTLSETTSPDPTEPVNSTKDSRLVIIVSSLAGAIVIVVIVIGVIMCVITERYKHFIDTVSGLKANFGEPQKRGPSAQRSEDQREDTVEDTLPPAPSPSLEEGETTEEDVPAPGNHVDGPAAPTTVTVHGENNEAVAEAPAAPVAAEAPAAPVAAGPVRAGTARRHKRDELPPTLPRPSCSWAEDENAYCELGGGHKPAIAPKPKPKARTFERQSPAGRGEETTGDATTKNPVDPVYHVLNPDHSENE